MINSENTWNMASTHLCHRISRPPQGLGICFGQLALTNPIGAGISFRPPKHAGKNRSLAVTTHTQLKWALRLSTADESLPTSTVDMKQLVDFLYDYLPHVFDDQGIHPTAYDKELKFRDPITKHDSIGGYLFNIGLLKKLFRPRVQLHWVKQTGPFEITTRWTVVMTYILLPWKPELVITGTSVMGVNPATGKFCSHLDFWDSTQQNDYFSLEGLWDVLKQFWPYKTPDLETPKYQTLKRTANFEVRKYSTFIVVETNGDKLYGSSGFNDVTGYIFGKNSTLEKIPITTPVFTEALDAEESRVSIQIVLPLKREMSSLPDPNQESINLRKVEGGIAAVSKFSGKPTEDIVQEKEKALRSILIRDGLKPKGGCLLARYNDPGQTWSFRMRNEVLIWLEEFSLD